MMNPIVLRLPSEDKELLELEARKQKQTLAEVVRRAIKTYLKTKPTQKSGAATLLEWTQKSERYKSAFKDTDLSVTYKKHLYGKR